MRPDHAADDVMRRRHRRHPIAHRLVNRVAQSAAAGADAYHLCPQRLHFEDVELLTPHVLLAHIDLTLQTEQGGGRGGGDAVLSRPRLGDDARLAHAFCQQRLTDAVVDLVGASVIEVFALEINPRAAGRLGQPLGEVEQRRPADVGAQIMVEIALKFRAFTSGFVDFGELTKGVHQRFRDVTAAVGTEASEGVRLSGEGSRHGVLDARGGKSRVLCQTRRASRMGQGGNRCGAPPEIAV